MSIALDAGGAGLAMPTPMPMPDMPQPSAPPLSSTPLGFDRPERKLTVRPILVVGVKDAFLAAIKKVINLILKRGERKFWSVQTTTFTNSTKFADWLEAQAQMRAEFGRQAQKHTVADGVFLVVGQVYVHVAPIWASCGASYNKQCRVQLVEAVTDAMADKANGGSGGGLGASNRDLEFNRSSNPATAYKKVIIIVLAMVAILFGGFEFEIRRRAGDLEWIGLPAPRSSTRFRVREFYREHQPERLLYKYSRKLERLLDKYAGKEHELFAKLRAKYIDNKSNETDDKGSKGADAKADTKTAGTGDKNGDSTSKESESTSSGADSDKDKSQTKKEL